jgi:ubiquinone/menaquinone biosynthesis C-methylase UbiE
MATNEIRFTDGAAYERMMGKWSQLAGARFLDWLAPPAGLRWIDIGCGNGAFTELLLERCAPTMITGVDPSEAQLEFARTRTAAKIANFQIGDAMALTFPDKSFDAAVMALVIFFVPDPVKGVSEMVRVVRPGGLVATYAWDNTRGGVPVEAIWDEMRALGVPPPQPPSERASRMEVLRELWAGAGIEAIETKEIVVERTFETFEEFWTISTGVSIGQKVAEMNPADRDLLRERVKARLPSDALGRISYSARANAIKGHLRG